MLPEQELVEALARIEELEAELKWLQNQHVRVCSSESRLRERIEAAKQILIEECDVLDN